MDDAQKAAQCKMAVRHFHAGRTGEALPSCQQVLNVDPNYAPALHLAGCIAGKQRKPQRALQYLTRAVEIDDTRAWPPTRCCTTTRPVFAIWSNS
jgi:Tfp pilus assembly protein PilF